jgi:phosphoribosylanthranilate isomerase
MSQLKVKVCGMRDPENIRSIGAFKPDYMGFIFYKDSPRYVGESFAIPDDLGVTVKRVGVFVNESTAVIRDKVSHVKLTAVQLHGHETAGQCRELKYTGLTVIKAFSLHDRFDFETVRPYYSAVDYLLFDAKGKNFGGNGVPFSWTVLEKYDQQIPFFLSGGLSNENLDEVMGLSSMNLHALDINSGVEFGPGIKDEQLTQQFISKMRSFE